MGQPQPTAEEMLGCVLGDLARSIDAGVTAALADEHDAVHRLRTAVRRMRNVLAAFADLLDPAAAGALRAGLEAYGDRLGQARDLEVRASDCAAAVDHLGLDALLAGRLAVPLRRTHAAAHADLVTWYGSPQAAGVVTMLAAAERMPVVRDAARPAGAVAAEAVLAQTDRTLGLAEHHRDDPDAAHALRKAGRRLRHVVDAVTRQPAAVLGDDAVRLGRAGAQVQALLGDHRDALLLADHVRAHARQGDDAAPCAAIVAYAEQRAADALAAVPAVVEELAEQRAGLSSDALLRTASS